MDHQGIADFEAKITEVEAKLSKEFQVISPINSKEEKKRFFSEEGYNPQFEYDKLERKDEEMEILDKLAEGLSETDPLQAAWKERIRRNKERLEMIDCLGEEKVTGLSSGIYGYPDEELIGKAKEILSQDYSNGDEQTVTSEEAVSFTRKALERMGLGEWTVEEGRIAANAFVNSGQKRIRVKKDDALPRTLMKRMLVHEVGTHVFRSVNGARQPTAIFRIGFPEYLCTEEGLAVNIEARYGLLQGSTLRGYAGRVMAVHLSRKKSFREVYDYLRKHFSEKEAWRMTLRAKRGLSDTSRPGGYAKDYIYLKGYYKVKEFLEKEGDKGLHKLYYGKIDVEHVHLLDKVEGLKEPELLPDNEVIREMVGSLD